MPVISVSFDIPITFSHQIEVTVLGMPLTLTLLDADRMRIGTFYFLPFIRHICPENLKQQWVTAREIKEFNREVEEWRSVIARMDKCKELFEKC